MKFPPEKNATFTQFHGAKRTGPANPPSYWHYVLPIIKYNCLIDYRRSANDVVENNE